jgi:heat shock protein HtpX
MKHSIKSVSNSIPRKSHGGGRAAHRRWSAAQALQTALLLLALGALSAGVGYVILGGLGLALGLITLFVLATAGLGAPASLLLRMNGGRPISYFSAPGTFALVEDLSARAEMDPPQLYLLPHPQANALAVGAGSGAALALSRGALRLLSKDELEGVIAHELAHIKNGDTSTLQIANTITRAMLGLLRIATWLAFFTVLFTGGGVARLVLLSALAIAVPVVVNALRAALSRTRELAADTTAAQLTGKPWALASALAKLEMHQTSWLERFLGRQDMMPSWLRSHPPTAERVRRLLVLAGLPT